MIYFPRPRPDSMSFKAWKIWILISMTFQDMCTPCRQSKVWNSAKSSYQISVHKQIVNGINGLLLITNMVSVFEIRIINTQPMKSRNIMNYEKCTYLCYQQHIHLHHAMCQKMKEKRCVSCNIALFLLLVNKPFYCISTSKELDWANWPGPKYHQTKH